METTEYHFPSKKKILWCLRHRQIYFIDLFGYLSPFRCSCRMATAWTLMCPHTHTHTHMKKKIKFMSQSRVHVTVVQTLCATYFRLFSFSVLFLEMELEHAARRPAPIANNIIDRLGNGKIPMTQTTNDRHSICYAVTHTHSHADENIIINYSKCAMLSEDRTY